MMKSEKRIARIKVLINRLENGEDVSVSSLSRTLTLDQIQNFKNEWASFIESKRDKKPSEILKYERKIKVAIQYYWRMEKYSLTPYKQILAKEYALKADNEFELALEYLRDIVNGRPSLRLWIDRDPIGCEYHPDSIPRCVTSSKSMYSTRASAVFPFSSKRELKTLTLEMALESLTPGHPDEDSPDLTLLNRSRPKNLDFSGFIF